MKNTLEAFFRLLTKPFRRGDPQTEAGAAEAEKEMLEARRDVDASKLEQRAGFALFYLVTALWALWCSLGLATWVDIPAVVSPADVGGVIAVIPSALTVIATGYLLGKRTTLIWLGLIPGAVMTAIGAVGFNSELVSDSSTSGCPCSSSGGRCTSSRCSALGPTCGEGA